MHFFWPNNQSKTLVISREVYAAEEGFSKCFSVFFPLRFTDFFYDMVMRTEASFSLEAYENPWPCKHSMRESLFLWSAHQQLESEELNYRCRAACEGQTLTFHPSLFLVCSLSRCRAESTGSLLAVLYCHLVDIKMKTSIYVIH